MSVPDNQKEILQQMGAALVMLQTAEKVIRLTMTFVLPRSAGLTIDLLKDQEEAERTKTIGYFLSQLRKRADVHEAFDALLKDFLKNRNDFIHDFSRVSGWDLFADGTEARKFLRELIWETETVMKVFLALIMAWQKEIGMEEAPPPDHEWFSDVETNYKPLVDEFFKAKGV